MRPRRNTRSGWWAIALALAGTPAGAQPAKVEVCVTAEGLTAEAVAASLETIGAVARQAGATLMTSDCCADDACLKVAFRERGLTGVAALELLRFGPMVSIRVRALDARRGGEILARKSRASAKGFPKSAVELEADLRKALEALGVRAAKTGRPTPAVRPTPSPDPPAEPEPGPASILSIGPSVGQMPPPGVEATLASRTAMHWAGGSLLAVGGLAVATGIGLLAGPMQGALDDRAWALDAWLTSSDPGSMARYHGQLLAADDEARTFYLAGWATLGVGAALALAGTLTLVFTPELPADAPLADSPSGPRLGPLLLAGGGGLMLELSW